MPASEARKRANEKYNQKAYDDLRIRVGKGRKEELQNISQAQGESLNGFVTVAIDERIARLNGSHDIAETAETPLKDLLVLDELGYDPKAEKPLYVENTTGKQYYVVPVPNDTQPDEYSENNVPF